MKVILLSGGSGKRLWPLSNDTRAKQFLKVLKTEDGQLESMVQRVWRQLSSVGLSKESFIVTGKAQIDILQSQLGYDVPIIIEPEGRDTFPAISLASIYLSGVVGLGEEEVVTVLPVDSYVDDKFFEKVKELEKIVNQSDGQLALIGIKPTYPSTKYGYIVPHEGDGNYFWVKSFVEKPSEHEAVKLIERNALWNAGIFAFRLGFLLDLLKAKGYPTEHETFLKQYSMLRKISFDYEVVEKTKKIIALSYNGEWKDLGTWNTLTEEMGDLVLGKGIISCDCENTHLVNELHIPVVVLGLSNVVVAASPNGILVTDKVASPRLKDIIHDFNYRPMYEEHCWGWYRVLDYTMLGNGQEVLTKRVFLLAGKNLSYQVHYRRSEIWTIISGEGEFVLNGELHRVREGDVLQISAKAEHTIKANTDLEFIVVQRGTELREGTSPF
ncbi:cupin domain-containing protein [Geobacillus thermoleovorans]|uniref:sugar phosphate nucleotidyltransferase n=1 Tax=Geobacillus thermoleovorans TaxID=33941 RepID=UPI0020501B96|nr:sugar phosphate nucleotidyltransferase [Geobacillus thermoleovorans]UPT60628.1 cupin domain-containing protein [Geobacillus thermoleovorans]